MPVIRRPAAPIELPAPLSGNPCPDRKSPFALVHEASEHLKLSKRTVRDLIHSGIFKLVPNPPNRKTGVVPEKPWRLLWSEIEAYTATEMRKAA